MFSSHDAIKLTSRTFITPIRLGQKGAGSIILLVAKLVVKAHFLANLPICSRPQRQFTRRRYLNGLFQGVDRDDTKDRAEDLRLVGRHVGVHVGDDRRSQEVPVGVLLDLHVATIELKCKLNGSLKRRVTLDQCLIVLDKPGNSAAVEDMPHNLEVVGSNPAGSSFKQVR